jgi:hypothetical protein
MGEKQDQLRQNKKLTSEFLATLIIDALVVAKIIKKQDLEKAIAITTEEIDARKAAGDY